MKQFAPYAGWIALACGFVGLLLYLIAPQLTLATYTLLGIALANGLFFLYLDRKEVKSSLKSRTTLYGTNSAIIIFAVLGILIFLNVQFLKHKHRIDLTETKFYTLAPQTQKVVSNLAREVKLTAFYQTDDGTRNEFQRLMDGYKNFTEKIKLEFVDPDKNPAITKQYGVTTYGTVVFESGKQETKVTKATEENVTNALLKVTQDQQKVIYFLKGHGEKNIHDKEKNGYSKVKESLEKDNFQIKTLLLLKTGEVPKDADLLVISGPTKPIQKLELEAIDHYLNGGGSVLILADPQVDNGWTAFLEKWGVEVQNDLIIDPMSKLYGGDYAAPVVSQYSPHGITKDFSLPTIFPLLRSVKAITTEGLESSEVLFSGPESWAETDISSGKARYNPNVDLKGPVSVAVAITKNLNAQKAEPGTQSSNSIANQSSHPPNQNEPVKAGLKANLVVIGDSDFASNNYFSFSGNGDFFLNSASWLLQEENLISIRPRKRKNSPLALTATQGNLAFVVGTILIPMAVTLMGVSVWWRRRSL